MTSSKTWHSSFFTEENISKSLKIKIIFSLIISNLFFYFLITEFFIPQTTNAPMELSLPQGWEKIFIPAKFISSVEKGKKISIYSSSKNFLCEAIFLNSMKEESELSFSSFEGGNNAQIVEVAIAPLSLALIDPDQVFLLYPASHFQQQKRMVYEVEY
jgi:hypothetical protein